MGVGSLNFGDMEIINNRKKPELLSDHFASFHNWLGERPMYEPKHFSRPILKLKFKISVIIKALGNINVIRQPVVLKTSPAGS